MVTAVVTAALGSGLCRATAPNYPPSSILGAPSLGTPPTGSQNPGVGAPGRSTAPGISPASHLLWLRPSFSRSFGLPRSQNTRAVDTCQFDSEPSPPPPPPPDGEQKERRVGGEQSRRRLLFSLRAAPKGRCFSRRSGHPGPLVSTFCVDGKNKQTVCCFLSF